MGKNTLRFLLLTGALALANLAAFYPGLMTRDSHVQFAEALSGDFTDQHPPIMAALWRMMLIFSMGPAPMLVVQLLLFWGAVALLGVTFINARPARTWVLPLLWFIPPVMGMTDVIWKDSQLAFAWLMLCAIMTFYTVRGARPSVSAATAMVFLFFYGLAVRHNAVFGAYPLAVWAVFLFTKDKIWLKAAALVAGFFAATLGFNAAISSPRYITQQLYLGDTGYISWRQQEMLLPPYITENPEFSAEKLYAKYAGNPEQVMFLPGEAAFYTGDGDKVGTLRSYWINAMTTHPLLYLEGRWQRFNGILRVGYSAPFSPYTLKRDPLAGDGFFAHIANGGFAVASAYLLACAGSAFNMPYLWAVLAVGLIFWAYRNRGHGAALPVLGLCSSGLCYMGGYFFVATGSDDLRLVYWSILSVAAALAITLIAGRFKRA